MMKQPSSSSTGGPSAPSTATDQINSTDPTTQTTNNESSILDDKLFFTTSDVIRRINATIHDDEDNIGGGGTTGEKKEGKSGGFELQRKFEGGYTCRANESDVALVDFQSKVKQAAQMVSTLSPEKKIEWATMHRRRGNALFQKCDYKEAMDVYLTCLVAIEHGSGGSSGADTNETVARDSAAAVKDGAERRTTGTAAIAVGAGVNGNDPETTAEEEDRRDGWIGRTDEEIKLPILLNLSACALKMGMHQKAEKFCDFAITEIPCGRTSTKAHFRRGRARMLMGSYRGARDDFDTALELLSPATKTEGGGSDDRDAEIKAVKNEVIKLGRLIEAGQKNRVKCKRAMKMVLGGGDGENDQNIAEGKKSAISSSVAAAAAATTTTVTESVTEQNEFGAAGAVRTPSPELNSAEVSRQRSTGLYDDMTKRRAYSTLRAKFKGTKQHRTTAPEEERTYVLWYITMMERSLRKVLYWLGDKDAMTRSFEELEDEFSNPVKEKRL